MESSTYTPGWGGGGRLVLPVSALPAGCGRGVAGIVGRACPGMGGVARCWALRNQAPSPWWGWVAVFLWLFGCWIVDASIFVAVCSDRSVDRICFCCVGLCVWRQAMKGVWWMPWHQEPMKDVGACDKPWGVGNRAVIRGCPNGETRLESCPVTCT